jgi:preprotein translocase subunit YajC
MFFVSDAWAQAGAAAPTAGGPLAQFFGGPGSTIVMFALMFAIMYFMLIRPQNEEKKKLEKAISSLQKGDKVLTTSGMVATVVTIDKERAILKINDDVKVEFVRAAIAQVLKKDGQ